MKTVIVRVVREDGAEFVIDNTNWMIPSKGLSGFGDAINNISEINNAFTDGATITAEHIPSVDRTVKAVVADSKFNEQMRHNAIEFFNAKIGKFRVYLTYQGLTRWCEGALKKVSVPTVNAYKRITLQFTVRCANPYMRSYDDFGQDIATTVPMVAFPWLCNAATGTASGRYIFDNEVTLVNNGDVPTFAKVKIVAKGAITNPKIIINGKFVRFIDVLGVGDEVEIDFVSSPPKVKKNGINAIGKCDRKSSFLGMQLERGDNTISYTADDGENFMSVSVYYNQLYLMI